MTETARVPQEQNELEQEEVFEPTIEESILASGGHKKGRMQPIGEPEESGEPEEEEGRRQPSE